MTAIELATEMCAAWRVKAKADQMLWAIGKKIHIKHNGDAYAAANDTELWKDSCPKIWIAAGKKWTRSIKARFLWNWAFPGVKAVDGVYWYKEDPNGGPPVVDKERTDQAKLLKELKKKGKSNIAGGERLISSGKLCMKAHAELKAERAAHAVTTARAVAAETALAEMKARLEALESKWTNAAAFFTSK